ncbi:hypothetical protein GCM10027296_25720 [Chitinimonas naiadis]
MAGWAQDTLTFYYLERPPYVSSNAQGVVSGVTVAPVERALRAANIAIKWVKVPWNRQVALIQADKDRVCGTLFYKTPERQRFAKFSIPFYQDQPLVFITRDDYMLPEGTFIGVMRNKAHRFIMKERVASAPGARAAIDEARSHTVFTYYESAEIMDMLLRGLGDVILLPGEEARYLVEQRSGPGSGLRIWQPDGMPEGAQRHVMCSLSVPDEWMQRINTHLAKP